MSPAKLNKVGKASSSPSTKQTQDCPAKLVLTYLYPDLMNTYGDRGNLLALKYRAQARGISLMLRSVTLGQIWEPGETDFYLFGGGQDRAQQAVAKDLADKLSILKEDLEANVPILAICGGYQLLGKSYLDANGERAKGLGLLNVETRAGKGRLIGNILVEALEFIPGEKVLGFENHGGRTYLGAGTKPFGKTLKGYGNNDLDFPRFEGAVEKHILGTYLHGSILPKNPSLTDWFLETALKKKFGEKYQLKELATNWEQQAYNQALTRL